MLKSDKLKQFAVVEEKRSKLYKSLIAKVNSNCIDEKLFSALPCEVYPPPPPPSSVKKTPLSPHRINGHLYPPPPPSSSVNKTPLSPYRINGHRKLSNLCIKLFSFLFC
ncbi:unnamed protein product [Trichobilharzia regenti]|nr:unnamed protein product [Trichobilharzia regenti]